MLKPAQLYRDQLNAKYIENWYDMRYQYYRCGQGAREITLPDNNTNQHDFVSVNADGDVMGYINYLIDWSAGVANNFGIVSFKTSTVFIKDVLSVIDDIFQKYKLNKIEFVVFADNPAIKGYRKLIRRYGGNECGYLRDASRLLDGQLHDLVMFEIMREDYFERKL